VLMEIDKALRGPIHPLRPRAQTTGRRPCA
jgi:hypothetical protein